MGIMVLSCHLRTTQPVDVTEHEKRVELNIERHGSALALLNFYTILDSSYSHKIIHLSCRRPNLNIYLTLKLTSSHRSEIGKNITGIRRLERI